MRKPWIICILLIGVLALLVLSAGLGFLAIFNEPVNYLIYGPLDNSCTTDSDCALKQTSCSVSCACPQPVNKNWNHQCLFGYAHPFAVCKPCASQVQVQCFNKRCVYTSLSAPPEQAPPVSRGLEETSLVFAYHYTWTSGEQAIITLDENRTLVYFYSIGPFAIGSYLNEQLSEENYETFLREIQVFYESGGDKNFSSKSAGTCAALKQGGPYRDLGPWPPIFMLNNSTHVVPLQFFTHISYHTQTIEGQPWRDLGTTLRETLRPICAN